MKALDTALKATASAAFTGALFALPLGLAMLWQSVPSVDEVEVVAAPIVLMAALPMSVVPVDGTGEIGEDAVDADGESTGGESAPPLLQPTQRTQGPMVASRTRRTAAPASQARPTDAKRGKKRRSCEPGNDGIERTAAGAWSVDRGIVEGYAKKPATMGELGWASVAEGPDGKNLGFKIGGITCGNDLHEAGLRNGDVVQSVNGKPVRSIAEAIWVYTTQRKADVVELRVLRNGSDRTLTYTMG